MLEGEGLPPAPIVGVHIEEPVALDLVEIPLILGGYDGTPYSTGSIEYDGMRVSVVATESGDGPARWAGSVTESGGRQEFF